MACLFCNIAAGEVNAKILYQDELIVAFDDIHPQAPFHKIIIPRRHISSLNDVQSLEDSHLLGHMMKTSVELAQQLKIAEQGYRVVMNCNADGGQTVFHIHLHLLGGRQMIWPPG